MQLHFPVPRVTSIAEQRQEFVKVMANGQEWQGVAKVN